MINTDLQKYIHISKYARWIEKEKRRETWEESVSRFINFWNNRNNCGGGIGDAIYDPSILQEIKEAILKQEIMPSMRGMMTAGKALERDNIAQYNCTTSAIIHPAIFSEAFYILMNGCGFGFSCERQYINKLPEVAEEFYNSQTVIVVRDSKIGWATALKELISMLYNGQIPQWDVSLVRPAGARLKTFGGRASGSGALVKLFEQVIRIFKNAKGRKLNSLECHDLMCHIADAVVVGSVRRAALISISNLSDERMRHAKDGNWWISDPQRALANNSVGYSEKPDLESFAREWMTMYKSKSGERGIWNKESAKKYAIETGRKNAADYDFLPNPCQPSYATVLTPYGIETIGNISAGDTIWSGKEWTTVEDKWSNGKKDVYKFTTTMGRFIGTERHKVVENGIKIEVGNASSIDWCVGEDDNTTQFNTFDIMDGLVVGDGSVHKASNNLVHLHIGEDDHDYFSSEIQSLIIKHRPGLKDTAYEINTSIKHYELPLTFERSVPDRFYYGGRLTKRSFLRGLFSANGSISGKRVTLKQSSRKLIEQVQDMLSSLGIHSYITTNKSKNIEFSNGVYECKESYELNITHGRDIFKEKIGFIQKYKQEKIVSSGRIGKYTSDIKDVEYLGEEEVFDIRVSCNDHTYWSGGCLVSNCGEVSLRHDAGVCNLSEVIIRPDDSLDNIKRKIRLATIMGTLQSSLTDFRFLRKVWKTNAEEERLLGVSLTGIMDHPIFSGKNKNVSYWSGKKYGNLAYLLKGLREYAHEVNKEWASILNISDTQHLGVVKPSGTCSLLTGTSSGIHPRYSKYYIRRVRNDKKDPLSNLLIAEGVPYVDEGDKYVFSFFEKSPDHSVIQEEMNAMQQLELWKIYKENWCDGNPSQTIYYTDSDYFSIADWIWTNWDMIGGLSFFPFNDSIYKNAPLEAITEEEYINYTKSFPKSINWDRLKEFENEDKTETSMTLACSGGQCDIV